MLFITVKHKTSYVVNTKLNLGHIDKFEINILKKAIMGSRSPDHSERGHFKLLFCRGWQL